jgi:hypothetical protein
MEYLKDAQSAIQKLSRRGDEGKTLAREVVKDAFKDRSNALKKAAKALNRAFPDFSGKSVQHKIKPLLDAHKKAAADVLRFVNSDRTYTPGTWGPGAKSGIISQKGQVLLEARIEIAIELYNQLEPRLLKAFGQRTRPVRTGGLGIAKKFKKGTLKDEGKLAQVPHYAFSDGAKAWTKVVHSFQSKFRQYSKAEKSYLWMNKNKKQAHARPEEGFETNRDRYFRQGYRFPIEGGECIACLGSVLGAQSEGLLLEALWGSWRIAAEYHREILRRDLIVGAIGISGYYVTFNGACDIENPEFDRLVKRR